MKKTFISKIWLLRSGAEVVLIILGVSISLIIDDWKEANSRQKRELEFLKTVSSQIDDDINDMTRLVQINGRNIQNCIYLIDSTKNESRPGKKSREALSLLNQYLPLNINFAPSTMISGSQSDLIGDDALKLAMLAYYGRAESLTQEMQQIKTAHFAANIEPYLLGSFSNYLDGVEAIPQDFQELKKDESFWRTILRSKNLYMTTTGFITSVREDAQKLKARIDKRVAQLAD